MLVVETVARIRREFFVKGKSIKEIVRDLGVSRNTVRKVLRSGETAFSYERSVQPLPKLGPWSADLGRVLEANERKARRERLTMIRVFEELQGLGYGGGYDAVRRYAAAWHRDRSAATAAAYVPLSFAPGEAYQFDWSHEVVLIGGVTTTVKVAHLRLCHSRMFYVRAYPRESQEMVFDAHDRAFAFLGGACQRGIYDNMKTAVDAIFVGRERRYNRRFEQMCGHYLVEPVACTPASGWEKGQVENQVGLVRERFFTPRLRFKSYEEMSEAADIMEFDRDGEPVDAAGRHPYLERYIHAGIYQLRADVRSVVHDHSREVVPFSVSRIGLRPVGHTGGVIGGSVPVWDIRERFGDRTNMLVSSLDMGLDLARRLGQGSTLLMRGHGAAIAAQSIRLATFIAISLDTQAREQREAMSLGPVNGLSPGEIAATSHLFDPGAPGDSMNRAWEYWCARAGVPYHPRGA